MRRNKEPKGAPTCRNIGLQHAAGTFVVFLDSDDLLAPWCLEERLRQFERHPGYDFLVFPILIFCSKPGDSDVLFSDYKGNDALTQFIDQRSPWQSMGPIWRKETVVRIGGWDESLATWQDWELPIRAMLSGLSYKIVDTLPDCFLRRSEHDRVSSNDMELSRLDSKLTLFKKVIELISHRQRLTDNYKKAFTKLYVSHAERAAIRIPNEKIIDDFLKEVKALHVLSPIQFAGTAFYIKLLRIAPRGRFKKATSIVYRFGHSFLPSSIRTNEEKPARLKKVAFEQLKTLMNNAN